MKHNNKDAHWLTEGNWHHKHKTERRSHQEEKCHDFREKKNSTAVELIRKCILFYHLYSKKLLLRGVLHIPFNLFACPAVSTNNRIIRITGNDESKFSAVGFSSGSCCCIRRNGPCVSPETGNLRDRVSTDTKECAVDYYVNFSCDRYIAAALPKLTFFRYISHL